MTRSRCTCEANSKTYLNTEVSHNCCHHGQLIRTLGPWSMQQIAYLLTPLLCYVMWPIHQTCNSMKDCSPFWTVSPMQENEDINHSFIPSFCLWHEVLGKWHSYACFRAWLHVQDIRVYICHHLHAVISYETPLDSLSSIDSCIDFTLPYYDQDQWFNSDISIVDHVLSTHGSFRFYHKSFYDFLHDPAHSGAFYVNTPVIYWCCNLLQIPESFDSTSPLLCIKLCYWWPKHVFPSSYLLLNLPVILELVLAPGIASFSVSLSWPHGTEFFDSYLELETFVTLSFCLLHDDPDFSRFFEDVPFDTLQQLADIDYHRSLIANWIWWEFRNWSGAAVLGTAKISPHTVFKCICADKFGVLVSTAFLWVRLTMITGNGSIHMLPGCQ